MPIVFYNVIQPAQIKQHLPLRFYVPDNIRELAITFDYEPYQVDGINNMLTLTLFDPQRARGERHRTAPHQSIIVAPGMATPGFVAGRLPPGEWTIVINTHMVLAPLTYRVQVDWSDDEIAPGVEAFPSGSTAARGTGWYRGDLHGHTFHSDAQWDVPDLVAYARREGLDFVTLSDHNTVSGLAQMDSLADDDLLTMGGMELTTYFGHALALGLRQWVDWRVTDGGRTMPEIAREVEDAGGLYIIAHPMSLGDPVCTGCDWQYADMMPGPARCVEIWNTTWDDTVSRNELALALWYRWLNAGYRMVATAGSDIHGMPDPDTVYGRDIVYAEALSERAILDAVRRGHLYLSAGPRLDLRAEGAGGPSAMMGDCLSDTRADLTVEWADVPYGSALRWIANGEVAQELPCHDSGSAALRIEAAGWALVELRDGRHGMLAVTNPIFFGEGWR